MSLIACRECAHLVSSEATSCPLCGCPSKPAGNDNLPTPPPSPMATPRSKNDETAKVNSTIDHSGQQEHAVAPGSAVLPLSDAGAIIALADLEQEEQERLWKFQGKRPQNTDRAKAIQLHQRPQERQREKSTWQHPLFWIPALAVFVLGGTLAVGARLIIRHNDKIAAEIAIKDQEDQETGRIIGEAMLRSKNVERLKAAKNLLEKLQSAAPATIEAQRQFGIDNETKLPQWQVLVLGQLGMCILLAEPDDFNYGTLIGDRKVAKVDRRQVSVRHTSRTGVQSDSLEYTDVYIVVTAARIAAIEQSIKELESGIPNH